PAIKAPVRLTEILVIFGIEVGPDNGTTLDFHKADAHLWIRIARFRVSCLFKISMLPFRHIDREHGHLRIVKTHKRYSFAVRRPPKSFVVCRPTQYLFIVYPGRPAVINHICSVACVTDLLSAVNLYAIEVMVAGESDKIAIRRKSRILFSNLRRICQPLGLLVAVLYTDIVVLYRHRYIRRRKRCIWTSSSGLHVYLVELSIILVLFDEVVVIYPSGILVNWSGHGELLPPCLCKAKLLFLRCQLRNKKDAH